MSALELPVVFPHGLAALVVMPESVQCPHCAHAVRLVVNRAGKTLCIACDESGLQTSAVRAATEHLRAELEEVNAAVDASTEAGAEYATRKLRAELEAVQRELGDLMRTTAEAFRTERETVHVLTDQRDSLLAALKLCVEWMPCAEVHNWPPGFQLRGEAMAAARAAISKARGG